MSILAGRNYVVTGGARGIGLAFCQAIVNAGGKVGILDILSEPHPDCRKLEEAGRAHYFEEHLLNVLSGKQYKRLVATLMGAGIGTDIPFVNITWSDFERVVAVNQTGTFFAVQLAVKQIMSQPYDGKTGRGSVVMVASASASGSCPGHSLTAYGGTKGFVKSFTLQLGHELANVGIRVNSISPGYIETDLNLNLAKSRPAVKHYFDHAPPMQRIGQTTDLTGGLIYLLSDASAYVTGIDLPIDGGMSTGNGLTS
ncbi:hypothetical protein LTR37_014160 [Vermiconidia calcicola]|uniref:Uncharacterized protein n=1 Tax=Vermiconidia calcicola TaxID=1690605 RepID=A0ACC3MX98_9PEZI|nr:hypothetical protein LTR37_014160 [Vermiconidia calcicola]